MFSDYTHTMAFPSRRSQQNSAKLRERTWALQEPEGVCIWEVTHGFWLHSHVVNDSQSLKDTRYSKLKWDRLQIKAEPAGRNIWAAFYLGNKMTGQSDTPIVAEWEYWANNDSPTSASYQRTILWILREFPCLSLRWRPI